MKKHENKLDKKMAIRSSKNFVQNFWKCCKLKFDKNKYDLRQLNLYFLWSDQFFQFYPTKKNGINKLQNSAKNAVQLNVLQRRNTFSIGIFFAVKEK